MTHQGEEGITDAMDTDGYYQQCHEFTESVRHMLGGGYGMGYQLSDLLRVLKARNADWERLSKEALRAALSTPSQAMDEEKRVRFLLEDCASYIDALHRKHRTKALEIGIDTATLREAAAAIAAIPKPATDELIAMSAAELDFRGLAVEIVDGVSGYTIERSPHRETHSYHYDLVEERLRAALRSSAKAGS